MASKINKDMLKRKNECVYDGCSGKDRERVDRDYPPKCGNCKCKIKTWIYFCNCCDYELCGRCISEDPPDSSSDSDSDSDSYDSSVCVNGYKWVRQRDGGYRCKGGQHYKDHLSEGDEEVSGSDSEAEEKAERLRRIADCPAGYTWNKVSGGYRCAGGNHFVTEAELRRDYTH